MPLNSFNRTVDVVPDFTTPNLGAAATHPDVRPLQLTVGTATRQANLLAVGTLTATTAGVTLDLNGGGMKQPDNVTAFNAVELVTIDVWNVGPIGTAGMVTVGGGSNAVADVLLKVKAGGHAGQAAPGDPAYPVVAGTGDLLKFATDTGTAECVYVISARNA